ncbi:LRR domain containing protein, partial [Trema orientale]
RSNQSSDRHFITLMYERKEEMSFLSFSVLCVLFLIFQYSHVSFSSSSAVPQCHPDERSALLQFRNSLSIATSDSLQYLCSSFASISPWNKSSDCCMWSEVMCDRVTGHVIGLNLFCSGLQGTISSNSSLFLLRHLQFLSLSGNDFRGSSILPEFGQFKNMTELDLSAANFSGYVPLEISHLSKLVSLQLIEFNEQNIKIKVSAATFQALARNLTNLRELQLSNIDMSSLSSISFLNMSSSLTSLYLVSTKLRAELPENVFRLPRLQALELDANEELTGLFPNSNWSSALRVLDLSYTGFSIDLPHSLKNARSLSELSLSYCNFVGSHPTILSNLTPQIVSLNLAGNKFSGQIPWSSLNLKRVISLDFSFNNFTGQLPDVNSASRQSFSLFNASKYLLDRVPLSLTTLSLSHNFLSGKIPSWIYEIPYLQELDLGNNFFTGNVEIEKLSNLKELSTLDLSSNNLSLSFNNSINYTFDKLWELRLSSCSLSEFPHFFKSSKGLRTLDLSRNQIQGNVPKWLWEVGQNSLFQLNLSHNFFTYIEPLPWKELSILDLSFNLFSGPLPILSSPGLQVLLGSKNQFGGQIPTSFCNMSSLQVLDLSYNNLGGKVPQCLGNFSEYLTVLDLRRNRLHGTLPTTCAKGNSLRSLNLNDNRLEGPLPRSLAHCRSLEVLDLGNNLLNDTFPNWLESLPELRILVLRSNKFHGTIGNPRIKFSFPQLRIMDLSYNEFNGALPTKYFESFQAMMNAERVRMKYMGERYYQDSVLVTMKGLNVELVKIQTILTTIDLSSNNFTGKIPEVIEKLKSLKGLNFSHNMLNGTIPFTLGKLTNLEWLDLSSNELVGLIPSQLTDLPWIAFLNLSQNHLVGPIPQGKQFNTFSNDSFNDNLDLCGFPLSKMCNEDTDEQNSPSSTLEQKDDSDEANGFTWKVVALGYGCGFVFGISMGYFTFFSNGKASWILKWL